MFPLVLSWSKGTYVRLALVFSLWIVSTAVQANTTSVLHPTQTWFLMADGENPPQGDHLSWQERTLPDNWDESQPGIGGNGWYRIHFELEQPPDRLWAIYLPRLRMNAAVFVNGVFVGDGGRFTEPMSRNWNRPLYFPIPTNVLHRGTNTLHIRLRAYANVYGGLYAVQIGPDEVLRDDYRWRTFLKTDLLQASMMMTVVMGLFLATLWLRWRQDSIYGWLAGTMLLWATNSTHFFVRDLPISTWWWEWAAQFGTDCFAVLLVISMHRFLGLQRQVAEKLMFAYLGVSGIILASVELDRMLFIANLLHSGAVIIGIYMVGTLLWHCWQCRFRDSTLVALTVGIVVQSCLGLHDWLLQIGVWQQDQWYLMHYAGPVLFVMLTWILTSRFVQALSEAKTLNAELSQRVAEKHAELEASYRQLHLLTRRQAVAEERERIMQDLHDGLGGHLVSALALVESHDQPAVVEQTLREALDDLRLVIDSLDPDNGDLLTLLGMVRMRVETRLSRHGLRFDWQVQDIPQIPGFGPEQVLQVLRILQEALTNVLKHARAHTITVRTGESTNSDGRSDGVYVEIGDDGHGLQTPARGRGLGNMQRRAQRIGGKLDVSSDLQGTRVRLWLPLQQAA